MFCENNRLTSIVDEAELSGSTNDYRKLQYKMEYFQQNLARLKTINGAAGKCWKLLENDRIELENELISCKSRIDQLELDNQRLEIKENENQAELLRKQAKIESFEKQNNELTSENQAAKNELINCKSRIDQLALENKREQQIQLEAYEGEKKALLNCEFI